jgi:hypothetical protein
MSYIGRMRYTCTTGKMGTFLGFFIFLDTEEYNGSIFLGVKTEECMANRRTYAPYIHQLTNEFTW